MLAIEYENRTVVWIERKNKEGEVKKDKSVTPLMCFFLLAVIKSYVTITSPASENATVFLIPFIFLQTSTTTKPPWFFRQANPVWDLSQFYSLTQSVKRSIRFSRSVRWKCAILFDSWSILSFLFLFCVHDFFFVPTLTFCCHCYGFDLFLVLTLYMNVPTLQCDC